MIKTILILFFIISVQSQSTNELIWCEEIKQTNDSTNKTIHVFCFTNNQMNDEKQNYECDQKHFVIQNNTIIFSKNVERKNVFVKCDYLNDFQFIFENERKNELKMNSELMLKDGNCGDGCNECNNTTSECSSCEKGYGFNSTGKVCIKCSSNDLKLFSHSKF